MKEMAHVRWACASLLILALASLACGGTKLGFQKSSTQGKATTTKPSDHTNNNTTPAETTPPVEEVSQTTPATAPITLSPSPEAIARAGIAKLPAAPEDKPVAGPFDAPEGTLLYASTGGKITMFHPEAGVAYFATHEPRAWRYLITHEGYFAFEGDAQPVKIDKPPKELVQWPLAIPVAKHIAQLAAQLIELDESDPQLATARRDKLVAKQDSMWGNLSSMSESLHEATGFLITQMNSSECTSQTEGEVYIGCF